MSHATGCRYRPASADHPGGIATEELRADVLFRPSRPLITLEVSQPQIAADLGLGRSSPLITLEVSQLIHADALLARLLAGR